MGRCTTNTLEAVELVQQGGAFEVNTALELEKTFNNLIEDTSALAEKL